MTASFAQQEIWHVMIASDDMKRMNVDQLDDAFRLDLVDASTLVWKTGMEGWRRLGSIAGIDDEPETISRTIEIEIPTRVFGPPAPPPPPRPRHQQRAVAPELNPFLSSAPVNPFASTTPAAVFTAPQLLAPTYSPPLYAPDPYVLPKRRVKVPSEVDFRRSSGVRWGRWLVGFMLLTAGVLGAYRQDYLRQGAQRLGIENKYIHGERRVTGWVNAKAPPAVKAALTRAALLPGPNALAEATPAKSLAAPTPAVVGAAAVPSEPTKTLASTKTDSDVKTVSLDSLPVLTAEQAAAPAAAPAAPAAAPVSRPRAAAKAVVEPKAKPAAKVARQEAAEEEAAPAPKAKAEPKPEPKAPKAPPTQMNTPLKAAIWAAMQKDK